MRSPTELLKGNAAALILACLAREPMHGYGIARELAALSDNFFVMGEGTLYPHLHQLEKDGLVEGKWESTPGRRERKLYRITSSGLESLARKKMRWQEFQSNVNRVLNVSPEPVA